MKRREAAIISAYTGLLVGNFSDMQEYAEEKFGRGVWTHEFADRGVADELKELAKDDFMALCAGVED